MADPVLAMDGNTYERSAITEWLKKNPTSPITRQPMRLEDLKTNRALLQSIERFKTASTPTVIIEVKPKQKQSKKQNQQIQQNQQTPVIQIREPTPNLYYELLEQAELEQQRQQQIQQSQPIQQTQQQQQQAVVVRPNIQKAIVLICPLTIGLIILIMIIRFTIG
jgi:preprotein translocase subunit SecF